MSVNCYLDPLLNVGLLLACSRDVKLTRSVFHVDLRMIFHIMMNDLIFDANKNMPKNW